MVDPNEHEAKAMEDASALAGEYIESLRQTDMARWSPEQWRRFIATVCGGYVESLCRQQAEINASLAKVGGPG